MPTRRGSDLMGGVEVEFGALYGSNVAAKHMLQLDYILVLGKQLPPELEIPVTVSAAAIE